jgi:HAD superfamily hydrolase (TIGR01490 family)
MPQDLQPLAVFDFDDTLVHGDSMWKFLALVAGWPNVVIAFTESFALYVWQHFLQQDDRTKIDRNTFFKNQLLMRLIAGETIQSMQEPLAELVQWVQWDSKMRQTLQQHHDKGHHIVIASGALDLYLAELVKDIPHHAILCTDIEVKDDKATGVMKNGNCVREGKAQRLAAYMAEHGPFGESWGYGNFPDDVPMMNLLKYRIIV